MDDIIPVATKDILVEEAHKPATMFTEPIREETIFCLLLEPKANTTQACSNPECTTSVEKESSDSIHITSAVTSAGRTSLETLEYLLSSLKSRKI